MTRLGNKILKMKQPIKKRVTNRNKIVKKKVATKKTKKKPLFGTSKLEEDFARDFLDKLDVKYVYQFEAKDIGRFYDFAMKHNKRVDELKDKWALLHGIPLLRIWEKDIRENPKGVMKELKKRLYIEDKKVTLTEKKNKRHVNKIK